MRVFLTIQAGRCPITYADLNNYYYVQGTKCFLHADGQYDQAISSLSKTLEMDPAGISVTRPVGTLEDGAVKFASEQNPTGIRAGTYFLRGTCYHNKGQDDQAIADYSKALEIDSSYGLAYYNRGLSYQHQGRYDRAIDDYGRALEVKFHGFSAVLLSKADACEHVGQVTEAIEAYKSFLQLAPHYPFSDYIEWKISELQKKQRVDK